MKTIKKLCAGAACCAMIMGAIISFAPYSAVYASTITDTNTSVIESLTDEQTATQPSTDADNEKTNMPLPRDGMNTILSDTFISDIEKEPDIDLLYEALKEKLSQGIGFGQLIGMGLCGIIAIVCFIKLIFAALGRQGIGQSVAALLCCGVGFLGIYYAPEILAFLQSWFASGKMQEVISNAGTIVN